MRSKSSIEDQAKLLLLDSGVEDDYFDNNFRESKYGSRLDFPQSFRTSSESKKETVYHIRSLLRQNLFDHKNYHPYLQSPFA
mmetsp:Transcript_35863/g.55012  ORF Transcript_35863/g.55012 Transcript_35863/m.55012 type:complete len:82 (-) Transcript_35863:637-882(-)